MPTSLRWRYLAVADVRLSEVVQTFLLGCYLTYLPRYNTESVTESVVAGESAVQVGTRGRQMWKLGASHLTSIC